jgi:hypothetical protein
MYTVCRHRPVRLMCCKEKGYETDLSLSCGARLWSRRPVRLERSMKKGSSSPVTVLWCKIVEPETG